MIRNLSTSGNWTGTPEPFLAPETTLDGEPASTELPDPEAPPAQAVATGATGGQPAAFHQWKDPTGKVHQFKTADELSKAMTQSFFLQSDYSKKTDGFKTREVQISAREKALEKQANDIKEIEKKYGSFRNFMSQRPELFNRFSQMLQQPSSPGEALSAAQEAMKPMLDELKTELASIKEWKAGLDWDRQRGGIHEKLSGEFGENYDREAVENFLSSVNEKDPESLYRFAFQAIHGQQDPILAQKRVAEQEEANNKHRGVLPGSGKAPAPKESASIAEARDRLLADLK
jgi:hypothetical protein